MGFGGVLFFVSMMGLDFGGGGEASLIGRKC